MAMSLTALELPDIPSASGQLPVLTWNNLPQAMDLTGYVRANRPVNLSFGDDVEVSVGASLPCLDPMQKQAGYRYGGYVCVKSKSDPNAAPKIIKFGQEGWGGLTLTQGARQGQLRLISSEPSLASPNHGFVWWLTRANSHGYGNIDWSDGGSTDREESLADTVNDIKTNCPGWTPPYWVQQF